MKNQSDTRRFSKVLTGTLIYMLAMVWAYIIFKVIKNDTFAFVIVFIVSCIVITGIFLIIVKLQSKRQEEYYQNGRNMILKRLSNEQFQPVILNNTDILSDDLMCKAKMGEDGNVICIIEAKVTMELSQDDFLDNFSID